MRKLFVSLVVVVVILFAGCDTTGVIGGDTTGVIGGDPTNDPIGSYDLTNINSRVVDSSGSAINVSAGSTSLGGSYMLSQEYDTVSTRSLTDSGNIEDIVNLSIGVTLLKDVDGSVYLDNGSVITEILPNAAEVYFYQAQVVNGRFFIGADNSLYKAQVSDFSDGAQDSDFYVMSGAYDIFAIDDNSGTNDDYIQYLVDSTGDKIWALASGVSTANYNEVVASHDPDGDLTSTTLWYYMQIDIDDVDDATSSVTLYWDDPGASNGFTNVFDKNNKSQFIVKSGSAYVNIETGHIWTVDGSGVSSRTYGADLLGTSLTFDMRYYLQDRDYYFTNGRYDLSKSYSAGALIPMTSTFIQDWSNKVYTPYSLERSYVYVRTNGDVELYEVVVAGGTSTITVTSNPNGLTAQDFLGDDTLVDDFWFDGTGFYFQTEAPAGTGVRYINL